MYTKIKQFVVMLRTKRMEDREYSKPRQDVKLLSQEQCLAQLEQLKIKNMAKSRLYGTAHKPYTTLVWESLR